MKSEKEYQRQYYKSNQKKIKEYLRQHCQEIREYRKEYYKNNKEKVKEYHKQWLGDNLGYDKQYYKDNREKIKERDKQYYKDDKEKIKERSKQYYKDNREKIKEYNIKNKKELNEKSKLWRKNRYRINLRFNLNNKMAVSIGDSLKGNKAGRHWEILVDYTLKDLIKRLKKTMPEGYTWQDYLDGKLHIDHIVPKSIFNFTIPEHPDFKRCWALDNLQLLTAKENHIKTDKN